MRQPFLQKFFLSLSFGTAVFFLIVSGFFWHIPKQTDKTNGLFSDKLKIQLSTSQLLHLFSMEIPIFQMDVQALDRSKQRETENPFFHLFFLTYTPKHPNDWIKEEIPAYSLMDFNQLVAANMTDVFDHPIESKPPKEFIQDDKKTEAIDMSKNKNVVFIYHTHNRESFLPETKTNTHAEINITKVGIKLGEELKKLGINAEVSTNDYYPDLTKYALSYTESFKTVKEALKRNGDYQFIFDIHRDGFPTGKSYDEKEMKKLSTIRIKGVDYATITFVIGKGNQNYQKNKEFAKRLHDTINELYPGLSKGITEKTKTSGTNGEYNQSVSPNSVLIEVGSNYNTLEEEYRTARALAEAVAEIYFEAKKVNATAELKGN
ncbi:stage II sporulation protein P [Tepidibacillus sp. LV47]|uniref:stage II sporulation protein P n=1 Tax=Tepidibacillus sp. LV47 TaxID=3398228 RepID=UPI003AAA6170